MFLSIGCTLKMIKLYDKIKNKKTFEIYTKKIFFKGKYITIGKDSTRSIWVLLSLDTKKITLFVYHLLIQPGTEFTSFSK